MSESKNIKYITNCELLTANRFRINILVPFRYLTFSKNRQKNKLFFRKPSVHEKNYN
jgi:hypothetical protein